MEYSRICVVKAGLRLLHCVLNTVVCVDFIPPIKPQELWRCL